MNCGFDSLKMKITGNLVVSGQIVRQHHRADLGYLVICFMTNTYLVAVKSDRRNLLEESLISVVKSQPPQRYSAPSSNGHPLNRSVAPEI